MCEVWLTAVAALLMSAQHALNYVAHVTASALDFVAVRCRLPPLPHGPARKHFLKTQRGLRQDGNACHVTTASHHDATRRTRLAMVRCTPRPAQQERRARRARGHCTPRLVKEQRKQSWWPPWEPPPERPLVGGIAKKSEQNKKWSAPKWPRYWTNNCLMCTQPRNPPSRQASCPKHLSSWKTKHLDTILSPCTHSQDAVASGPTTALFSLLLTQTRNAQLMDTSLSHSQSEFRHPNHTFDCLDSSSCKPACSEVPLRIRSPRMQRSSTFSTTTLWNFPPTSFRSAQLGHCASSLGHESGEGNLSHDQPHITCSEVECEFIDVQTSASQVSSPTSSIRYSPCRTKYGSRPPRATHLHRLPQTKLGFPSHKHCLSPQDILHWLLTQSPVRMLSAMFVPFQTSVIEPAADTRPCVCTRVRHGLQHGPLFLDRQAMSLSLSRSLANNQLLFVFLRHCAFFVNVQALCNVFCGHGFLILKRSRNQIVHTLMVVNRMTQRQCHSLRLPTFSFRFPN